VRRNLAIIAFSFVPTLVFSSVGILALVFQRAAFDIVFGVLVLIFSIAVMTGGIIVQRVLSRQARTARLQTDFVAKVSHELRTPLASIRLFVDTLQGGQVDDPQEQDRCLDVISTETSRLTSMIERLLAWGQMEAGRRSYEMRPESVVTLVGEALAQLETQLQSSGATLELDLPDDPPAVLADRQALVETLLNMLSNAVKYGGAGPVKVRVQHDKTRVSIEIQDAGPGIPRKEHRRIFERFYRGSGSVVSRTPGSGLGLAMANLVVRAHRGKIRLRSALGEGACFTVDLPVLRSSAAALEVPAG
jgi:two-component system phosphate regulon sensor histidine kinase PhoR